MRAASKLKMMDGAKPVAEVPAKRNKMDGAKTDADVHAKRRKISYSSDSDNSDEPMGPAFVGDNAGDEFEQVRSEGHFASAKDDDEVRQF